jgi:hypothetical protein
MFNTKVMRTIFKENHFQNANMVSLKTGQLYMGKIQKLYPQNMALVQLGAMKLFAKVEAALTLGHYYWFQVMHHDDHIHLKVTGNLYAKNDLTSVALDVLKEAALPVTKENVQILLRFLQNDVPMPRNILVEGLRFVQKGADLNKAVNALQMIINRNLPFNETVFRSLLAVQSSVPLHEDLARLAELMTFEPNTDNLLLLKHQIKQFLEHTPSNNLLDLIIQKVYSQNVPAAASLLEKMGMTPSNFNWNNATAVNEFLQSLQNDPQALLTFSKKINKFTMDPNVQMLFSDEERNLLNELNKIVVQKGAFNWESSDLVSKTLKHFFSLLGLQYEYEVASHVKHNVQLQEFTGIKPLLLKALSDITNPETKELADAIIHRLTGQQLLSFESGPIQQIILQVPIKLGHHCTDLTVQWSGKKRNNGEIDPDYCRIVFYLYLETIKETIIDVHIQNRIIHISIINDFEQIEPLAMGLYSELKEHLVKFDYQLSSIKITLNNKNEKLDENSPLSINRASSIHTGVDIRI